MQHPRKVLFIVSLMVSSVALLAFAIAIYFFVSSADEFETSVPPTSEIHEEPASIDPIEVETQVDVSDDPAQVTQSTCNGLGCVIKALEGDLNDSGTYTGTLDLFGLEITNTNQWEIRSPQNGGDYYYKSVTLGQTVRFSDAFRAQMIEGGATAEQIAEQEAQANEVAKGVVGFTQECTFPPAQKAQMLQVFRNWQVGTASTEDLNFANCTTSGGSFEHIN